MNKLQSILSSRELEYRSTFVLGWSLLIAIAHYPGSLAMWIVTAVALAVSLIATLLRFRACGCSFKAMFAKKNGNSSVPAIVNGIIWLGLIWSLSFIDDEGKGILVTAATIYMILILMLPWSTAKKVTATA